MDTLRLVKPTAAPWHRNARRDFRQSLADWHRRETDASSTSVAADVARLWLEWAGAEAQNDLRLARLQRVERALDLFENRYRLGEVAGTEVRQLEAQRASDRIALTESQLRAQALRDALLALLGFEPAAPTAESLGELSGWFSNNPGTDVPGTDTPGININASAAAGALEAELIDARAALADDLATFEAKTAAGTPSVGFELERVPSFDSMSSFEAFGFHVSLPLPFGRSVNQRRTAAREQGTLAQAQAERARSGLERDLTTWQRQRMTLKRELAQIDALVEDMTFTEKSLNEQFRLGAISYLVFLDGVARLEDVRLRHIELQQRHIQAHIELGRLTGDPLYFPLPTVLEATAGSAPLIDHPDNRPGNNPIGQKP
jgi:outer membrane protein TolC